MTLRIALLAAALASAGAGGHGERPDVREGHRLGNVPRSRLVGEVRVISPARPPHVGPGRHRRHSRALHVSVPLTIRDAATGAAVKSATVTTGTRFRIAIEPGLYRVSARIGPPVVNPASRACGSELVRAHPRTGGRVLLYCTVTG